MTIQQFDKQHGTAKPYFEYWFGEPVQKSIPTWTHSLLQKIIMRLLDEAGYVSGAEVKLKISPDFQPLPDVTAVWPGQGASLYPTTPVEVVVEILSPDDQLSAMYAKCRFYHDLAIQNIYVVDPNTRQLSRWSEISLAPTTALLTIPASEIWNQLDRQLQKFSARE